MPALICRSTARSWAGQAALSCCTHSPDNRRSRVVGPQEPWLQGHARAARSRDGVHRRRLHGRSDLVAEPCGQAAAAGGRRHLSWARDAGVGNGAGVAAEGLTPPERRRVPLPRGTTRQPPQAALNAPSKIATHAWPYPRSRSIAAFSPKASQLLWVRTTRVR